MAYLLFKKIKYFSHHINFNLYFSLKKFKDLEFLSGPNVPAGLLSAGDNDRVVLQKECFL